MIVTLGLVVLYHRCDLDIDDFVVGKAVTSATLEGWLIAVIAIGAVLFVVIIIVVIFCVVRKRNAAKPSAKTKKKQAGNLSYFHKILSHQNTFTEFYFLLNLIFLNLDSRLRQTFFVQCF